MPSSQPLDQPIDSSALEIRRSTYSMFAELGRAPQARDVAARSGLTVAAVESAWRRLHDARALVLDPATGAIRMAHPFSAVPTDHRVHARDRWWYANCAWDAFGICAALHADGRIETACHDCGDRLVVEVRDQQPSDPGLSFHCLVPAAHWWDDIAFT